MDKTIRYSTAKLENENMNEHDTQPLDVTNADIVVDALQLILILFVRLESPTQAKSLPVLTKIPQLLESISDEKKLAIAALSQSRNQIIDEMNTKMKEVYFTHFDKYMFKRNEKELAWLLLKAHSTKECVSKLHTSESQFRYCIKKMCTKTKTESKEQMVSKLRGEIENF